MNILRHLFHTWKDYRKLTILFMLCTSCQIAVIYFLLTSSCCSTLPTLGKLLYCVKKKSKTAMNSVHQQLSCIDSQEKKRKLQDDVDQLLTGTCMYLLLIVFVQIVLPFFLVFICVINVLIVKLSFLFLQANKSLIRKLMRY